MNKFILIAAIAIVVLIIIIIIIIATSGPKWVRDEAGKSYVRSKIARANMETGSTDGNIVFLGRHADADKCEAAAKSTSGINAWTWVQSNDEWNATCYGVVNPVYTTDSPSHTSGHIAA